MTQSPYSFTKRAKEQNIDIRLLIMQALEESDCNLAAAAARLGLTRQGLQHQMRSNSIVIRRCVIDNQIERPLT